MAVPPLAGKPSMPPINRLIAIMKTLRSPEGGCPWDREQTFSTISPYTVEEAYEVADAIDQNDMVALREELGDLLFQVVFHAQLADEAGCFDFSDVAEAICHKMVRRHPHVFAEEAARDVPAQIHAWEATKAEERASKGNDSILDGVAGTLPPLTRALKLQARAARVGFDWPGAFEVIEKIDEELSEIKYEIENDGGPDRLEDEMGDLLFACVNLARKLTIDPDRCLKRANAKFDRRFRDVEGQLRQSGRRLDQASLDEMEALWLRAKRLEKAEDREK
jgi:MazG family protein